MIAMAILYAMGYFQNRLLYNMCIGTLKKESFNDTSNFDKSAMEASLKKAMVPTPI
jgi:hypothetical protein